MGSRTGFGDARTTEEAPAPKGLVRDYLETILVCVVFVIFTRAFVFQQSKIPTGSMEDTLLVGDYIMVNRFIYSPTQFNWERHLLPVRPIKRGDIVVFKFPQEPEIDYIKRVVGLPGDTLMLKEGHLLVNGERISEPYVREDYRNHRDFGPVEVEPDHYFMMGDHRNNSNDSRGWGQVRGDMIKGRALLVWWSYPEDSADVHRVGVDRLKSMARKLATFVTRSRWSRCFTLIR